MRGKIERSKVDFPLWRKKVDGSLFHHKGTVVPNWVCSIWGLIDDFHHVDSRKNSDAKIVIRFQGQPYDGWITVSNKTQRANDQYRLWFNEELLWELKKAYLMTFMRDLEAKLREKNGSETDVEKDIPFWEFLDIEFDRVTRTFYFTPHYTQLPTFPELFRRIIDSPVVKRIDDELEKKESARIHKQDWRARDQLDFEVGADNVLYILIDTVNRLLYVGEAGNLVKRLSQPHPSIPHWNYYRYNALPAEMADHRVTLERMTIRDFASILTNKKEVSSMIAISDYQLANDKIDS